MTPPIPPSLIAIVASELREFAADNPDIVDVLNQDAERILRALVEAGVTLPEEPESRWFVAADADGVSVRDRQHMGVIEVRYNDDRWATAALAERVAKHLNGDCTRRYADLVAAAEKPVGRCR